MTSSAFTDWKTWSKLFVRTCICSHGCFMGLAGFHLLKFLVVLFTQHNIRRRVNIRVYVHMYVCVFVSTRLSIQWYWSIRNFPQLPHTNIQKMCVPLLYTSTMWPLPIESYNKLCIVPLFYVQALEERTRTYIHTYFQFPPLIYFYLHRVYLLLCSTS